MAHRLPQPCFVDVCRRDQCCTASDWPPARVQVKDYKEDPLNFVGKMRARTSNELLKVPPILMHPRF